MTEKYGDYISNTSFSFGLELWNKKVFEYLEGVEYGRAEECGTAIQLINSMRLESVVRFLFDNIGNPLLIKKDHRYADIRWTKK